MNFASGYFLNTRLRDMRAVSSLPHRKTQRWTTFDGRSGSLHSQKVTDSRATDASETNEHTSMQSRTISRVWQLAS
jgi:hypothetical protein